MYKGYYMHEKFVNYYIYAVNQTMHVASSLQVFINRDLEQPISVAAFMFLLKIIIYCYTFSLAI